MNQGEKSTTKMKTDEKNIVKAKKYNIDMISGCMGAIGVIGLLRVMLAGGIAGMLLAPISVFLIVIAVALELYASKIGLTVTDKRIYGTAAFGKRVDLPFDMISAVGTTSFLKTVSVSTSSGVIKFALIKNNDEIHQVVSKLLIERQDRKIAQTAAVPQKMEAPKSTAEELKEYKELFDSGVITQEEFDAKKKQLLGL